MSNKVYIIVLARTLNEERNIERFCRCYSWADKILIADGDSSDKTVALAKTFSNVEVSIFTQKVFVAPVGQVIAKDFMNPESPHQNFLIHWAQTYCTSSNNTWFIADDVDCVPTLALQQQARQIFEDCTASELLAYKLYCWMDNEYFPDLNKPGQRLWAWKPPETEVICNELDPFNISWTYVVRGTTQALVPPCVLLHRGWPSEEVVQEKLNRYKMWGRPQIHPKESCGPLAVLPEWAKSE